MIFPIVDAGLEAEIGTPIYLQIAIFAKTASDAEQIPFTMCHDLPLTVTISDDNFVREESLQGTLMDGACTFVPILGKSFGTARVTIWSTITIIYFIFCNISFDF